MIVIMEFQIFIAKFKRFFDPNEHAFIITNEQLYKITGIRPLADFVKKQQHKYVTENKLFAQGRRVRKGRKTKSQISDKQNTD